MLALWLQLVARLGSVRAARRCRKTTMASESVHAACARTRVSAVRRCHRHPAHHRLLAHGVVVQLRSSRHPLCCASASPDRRRAGGRRSFWPARARSQGGMEERRPGGAPPLARALPDTGSPLLAREVVLVSCRSKQGRGAQLSLPVPATPLSRRSLALPSYCRPNVINTEREVHTITQSHHIDRALLSYCSRVFHRATHPLTTTPPTSRAGLAALRPPSLSRWPMQTRHPKES